MAAAIHAFTVELEGELLGTFDEHELTVDDLFVFENNTGMLINHLLVGIQGMDVTAKALRALVWFMKYKAGKPVDIASINFKTADLKIEAVPNPTRAASGRSKATTVPAATGTSDTSPSTAT